MTTEDTENMNSDLKYYFINLKVLFLIFIANYISLELVSLNQWVQMTMQHSFDLEGGEKTFSKTKK